jgi:hypoxanthine phosphoribosyltransferase
VIRIKEKVFTPYISQDKILKAVYELATQLNQDLKDKNPLFLAVLNGSFMFASDLLKEITVNCEISFVKLASYEGTSSSGKVKELLGLNESVKGRTVVILEDIVDSGLTVTLIREQLKNLGADRILICTALFKPAALQHGTAPEYIGFSIGNEFVIGYGLDYDGQGRNLKDIHIVA